MRSGRFRQGWLRTSADRLKGDPRIAHYLCAIAAVALAAPGYKFPYLFDDYEFLGRAQAFGTNLLVPEHGALFYRPLSRGVYFWLLGLLSNGGSLLGGNLRNEVDGHLIS